MLAAAMQYVVHDVVVVVAVSFEGHFPWQIDCEVVGFAPLLAQLVEMLPAKTITIIFYQL